MLYPARLQITNKDYTLYLSQFKSVLNWVEKCNLQRGEAVYTLYLPDDTYSTSLGWVT